MACLVICMGSEGHESGTLPGDHLSLFSKYSKNFYIQTHHRHRHAST